jgi:putative MATE family efflux protein
VGSTALVARFVGAGLRERAVRVANQSIVLAVFLGLVASVLGVLGVERLVGWLQLEGDAAVFAADYLRPIFALLVFQMIAGAGTACLAGAGDTRTGLYVLGGVALVNVPLASFFQERYGFMGIAVGTAISHLIGGIIVLAVLCRGRAGLQLHLPLLWPDFPLLRRLLRISIPAGFDSLLVAVGQLCFLTVVNRLGVVESSAHGIALRWEALAYLAGMAFGTAAMTMVGQNLGAGRPARAAQSGWNAYWLCCLMMCLCGLLYVVLAPWMFALFCPFEAQRPVIEMGVPVLRFIALAMPPLAATIVFTQALRGAGDVRVPVLFTLVGFFAIRLPLAYWLTTPSMGLGLMGAWIAMAVDVFARGGFVLLRFASGRWRGIAV